MRLKSDGACFRAQGGGFVVSFPDVSVRVRGVII